MNPRLLLLRILQVLQILLQISLLKLQQKLRLRRRVESPNIVDKLTFGHGKRTFQREAFVPGLQPG